MSDTAVTTQTLNCADPDPVGGGQSLHRKTSRRYKFIRSIGFGGMKAVLLVWDMDTNREVAMAMMPDFRDRPPEDLKRFIHEAKITASLEHPNIIPLYDMGLDESGSPFFTMKYLRGESLAQYLARVRSGEPEAVKSYTVNRMLQICIRVCNAIRFAHSRQILHLDIKPDNVSIGDFGEVSVLDWGVASELVTLPDGTRKLRRAVSKGTPGYSSPEQLRGGTEMDERADIYSLGALLYAMLALHGPMAGARQEEIMEATECGRIPPLAEAAAQREIPEALAAIVSKAMALRPQDRYLAVQDFREDIQSFMAGFAPQAEHASLMRRAALFVNRNFMVTVLAALVLLLLTALLFVLHGVN